jgi:hypothetical protein
LDGVLDFISLETREENVKNEYSWNIPKFKYLEIFEKKTKGFFEWSNKKYFRVVHEQRFMLVLIVFAYSVK